MRPNMKNQMSQLAKYILVIYLSQLVHAVVAQNYTLAYKELENATGVLGGRVNSFYEDKDGFIWLGTPKGVARFDGHQFKWLTLSNSRLRGIPRMDKFAEDDEGNLWVFSFGKIDLINPQTFEVQPLEEKLNKALTFNGNFQEVVYTDDNYIFFKCKSKTETEWYKYHSTLGLVRADFIPEGTYKAMPLGDNLWLQPIDNQRPTLVFNYKTQKKVYEYPSAIYTLQTPHLGKEVLWTSTKKSFELFEFVNGNLESIFRHEIPMERKPPYMLLIYLPEYQTFVTNFNAANNGLSVIDIKNQQLIPITNSKQKKIINSKKAWVSRAGLIFLPKARNLLMLQIKPTYFQQYPPYKSYRGIRVFGDYLFANKYKVSLIDPNTIQTREEDFIVWGVENDLKQRFWAANQNSIGEIDIATNNVKNIIPYKGGNPLMWSILKSKKGRWWIGSYHDGILVSNFPKNDSLYTFDQFNDFEELQDIRVNHIMEDGEYIWASSIAGLFLIHKEAGVLQRYSPAASSKHQLPINDVYFLYKDAAQNYWLATSAEGLVHFKINEKFEITEYKKYTEEDGLSSNILYAILEDNRERLWISTYNGISCFDKKTAQIQAFTKEDGIHELEFNRNSYTQTDDGRIFFGSLKGVTAFYPDEVIRSKSYNPPIFITQFFQYKKSNNEVIDQTLQVQQT